MNILHLAKSSRTQKLTSGLTAIVCLVLASFIVRVPSASADTFTCVPSTQHAGSSRVFTQESAERFEELRNKILRQEDREGTNSQKQAQYWQEVREASGWVSRLDFAHNYVDHPYVGHEIIINATDDWCYDPVRSLIYLTVAEAEALKPVVEKRGEDRKENLRKSAEIRRRIREQKQKQKQQQQQEQEQEQQQVTVEPESTTPGDEPNNSSETVKTETSTEQTDNLETQSESEVTSSTPDDYKYRTPQPLITRRSTPSSLSSSPEAAEEPEPQTEPAPATPQPDQEQSADIDSGNTDPLNEPLPHEVVLDSVDEVASATSLGVFSATQPASPIQTSSGNTRAVLWGIVASMSTMLVLGSLLFRQKDQD